MILDSHLDTFGSNFSNIYIYIYTSQKIGRPIQYCVLTLPPVATLQEVYVGPEEGYVQEHLRHVLSRLG